MIRDVVILGAGFSGTLQAINLLRHGGPRATLVERSARLGRGVAYSAAHPSHLLNVRAANMSALPDDPGHFVRWLQERGKGDGASFVPRITYGAYLAELLDEAVAAAPDRLRIVRGDAIDIEPGDAGDGYAVLLADGGRIHADAVVLAVGNLPPHAPPGLDPAAIGRDHYAEDPWAGDIADGLADGDLVLMIGTGLTMVDAALLLEERGFRGRILALSRRGLVPRAHAPGPPVSTQLGERPPIAATALLREVRARADAIGWRAAVDELRPYSQGMWLAADADTRARFLRHLRPWWDVHRHRLAPEVAARLEGMRASGRLDFVAGRTLAFRDGAAGVEVDWRPRGAKAIETLLARRVVNCSGPLIDLDRTEEPLLANLRARGVIRPDPSHIGLDVDPQARVIGRSGRADPRLFALGPLTRGAFWEVVAVPDIRVQTWNLARRLSNAHWIGGEGL
ncbi:FAD/NAD(P)-binding protein [Sphingomonas fennica]|uniref:FAD-dependent oxidoreductase n=1 Tax=Edaphosphingomonas fennica TaxID=114404 RepID=A0A2T4HZ13_9SPHN|nr:FAD/NAD(P)-binding protein [Sphingomonas fennica]PTD21207.1 FAD-dependent oxidoreductase [Sphingomonas fennica]